MPTASVFWETARGPSWPEFHRINWLARLSPRRISRKNAICFERLEKLKTERTVRFERKFVRKNGEIVPVEVSVSGVRGGYFQAILRDISERKRAEALFTGEKRLLEMIATGVALKEILNALCLIIEEFRNGTLASVLLLNPDGLHLKSAAGPSLPKGWTQQMEKLPIGPCAGSCGTAAYRRSPVIVSDIATDPLWDVPEHRASALKHGLRASWSNPVFRRKEKSWEPSACIIAKREVRTRRTSN